MPPRLGSACSSSGTDRRPYAASKAREAAVGVQPACQTGRRLCHNISRASRRRQRGQRGPGPCRG
eukprot:8391226-Alexandrium_andersonii.AAC.1